MTMTVEQKRLAIKRAYPNSISWQLKVDKFPEERIHAVYNRLLHDGKLKGD